MKKLTEKQKKCRILAIGAQCSNSHRICQMILESLDKDYTSPIGKPEGKIVCFKNVKIDIKEAK